MVVTVTLIFTIINGGCTMGYDLTNKPTEDIGWIPDNTTNITDPSSRKTAGYVDGVLGTPPAGEHNWIFNRLSQWQAYLKGFTNNFYVDPAGGDDANPGTALEPFETFPHAIDQVNEGGRAVITLKGDIDIIADDTIWDKTIYIVPDTTEEINFTYLAGGGTNDDTLYKITLAGSASLVSFAKVNVPAADYDTFQSAFLATGWGALQLLGGLEIEADLTATNKPSVVDVSVGNSGGKINLFTGGTITTNIGGYVVGPLGAVLGGSVYDYNNGSNIDVPQYWWEDYNSYEHTMTGSATTNTDDFKLSDVDITGSNSAQTLSAESDVETFYSTCFKATVSCTDITLSTNIGTYILYGSNIPSRFEQWDPTMSNPSTYGRTVVVQLDKNIVRNF